MRLSNIIYRPIITEKGVALTESNMYAFVVNMKATKDSIALAIKDAFNVDVLNVRTMVMPGKPKRVRKSRIEIKTKKWKKAVITIKKGQKIDMFASLIGGEEKK